MRLTEKDAKLKLCPLKSLNSCDLRIPCQASNCMAWRYEFTTPGEINEGYCGAFGRVEWMPKENI
jgi:hypothetical protein